MKKAYWCSKESTFTWIQSALQSVGFKWEGQYPDYVLPFFNKVWIIIDHDSNHMTWSETLPEDILPEFVYGKSKKLMTL